MIKKLNEILELEELNMTPILNQHGQTFDRNVLEMDILKHNSDFSNTFCFHSQKNVLNGYFRYNYDEEKNIIVRSIQLRPGSNSNVFRKLLFIAYRELKNNQTPRNPKIYGWVNTLNIKSFKLLTKLGFTYENGNRDASKLSTTKIKLLEKLKPIANTYNLKC